MNISPALLLAFILLPTLLLLAGLVSTLLSTKPMTSKWLRLTWCSALAALISAFNLSALLYAGEQALAPASQVLPLVALTLPGAWIACLVQLLGTVILAFSRRYLYGESRQRAYMAGVAGVLASVQLLLVADSWWLLIPAWSATGIALDGLLRFYPERPFAVLAAHKKKVSDRVADFLLVMAAGFASIKVGSGSISGLLHHITTHEVDVFNHLIALCLVAAVAIRLALLPLHGWLIQVMEAPTPVSALLHAGVVNLGGFVLIKFSPLLESSEPARWVLIAFGLFSTFVAGFVMLTRVSIKVRLAWSTLAQMGFIAVECGLGMYQFAMLHLLGHSIYKAHAFLQAGNTVNATRLLDLDAHTQMQRPWTLLLAPMLSAFAVLSVVQPLALLGATTWPWWWSAVLALAWAPVFWIPRSVTAPSIGALVVGRGVLIAAALTAIAWCTHLLPFGVNSTHTATGSSLVVTVMALIYLGLALLRSGMQAPQLERIRRVGYAGLYLDDWYTRLLMVTLPPDLPSKLSKN